MNQEAVPLSLVGVLRYQFLHGNGRPLLLLALFLKKSSEVCLMSGFCAGEEKRNLDDVPKRQDLNVFLAYCLTLGSFPLKVLIVLVPICGYLSMSTYLI